MTPIDFFFTQIMSQPALMLGLMTLLGHLALRHFWYQALAGALRAAVGLLILQVGAEQLVEKFRPLLLAVSHRFHLEGVVIDPYAALPAVNDALGPSVVWIGYTVMVGLATNCLLVALKKYTGLRALFMSGHIMVLQAGLATWIIHAYFHAGAIATVTAAGILVGLYWSIASSILIPMTEAVTGGAGFTVGHQQMLGCWLAAKIAPRLGRPEDSVEQIELPGWLTIFEDNIVATSIVSLVFFGALMLALGPDALQGMAGSAHWTVFILLRSLSFAVYVTIMLTGVRLFVAELTVAFKGVSDRLLPGAVVAVDCAAVFPYAPQAVLFGFVAGAAGQLLGITGLLLAGSPILIIPGFVPLFFDNATIAVFANRFGGWRAAGLMALASGLVQVLGSAWAASLSGLKGAWQGNFDQATLWPAVMQVLKWLAGWMGAG